MKKKLFLIMILFIALFPKINIISVSGNGAGIRIDDVLILFIFISYFRSIFIDKDYYIESEKFKKIIKIFSFFVLINLISTIVGIALNYVKPLLGILYFARKIEYFVMIIITYDVFKRKMVKEESFYKLMTFILFMHLIISLLQFNGFIGSFNRGEFVSTMTQGRVSSTFNGAYEFSAFFLLLMPIYLYRTITLKQYSFINISSLAIIVICTFLTDSRTSVVVMLIMLFMFLIKEIKNKAILGLIICIGILITCIYFLFDLNIGNIINNTRFSSVNIDEIINVTKKAWYSKNFDGYLKTGKWYGEDEIYTSSIAADASYTIRVYHWMQLIDGFLRSPIIGVGNSISGGSADGNYIRILSESGLLGLLTWIYLLIYIGKSSRGNDLINKNVHYALISIVLGAFLIDLFEASKIMMFFWVLLGILLSQDNKEKEKENEFKEYSHS